MQLTTEPITLDLRVTWRIAHGSCDQRFNALAFLSAGPYTGTGEGAGVPQWGETQAGIMAYLTDFARHLNNGLGQSNPDYIDDLLSHLPPGSRAAQAAIDIALHDLWGQRLGQPLYRLLGLNPVSIPATSFTVAIDEPARMAERAAQSGHPIIKIKLGSPDDEAIVAAIRQATSARLRVDANAGWTREQAARLIPRLAQYDLEFVEQPLPKDDIEGLRWLRQQKLGLPIFADESARASQEIAGLAGAVDGIVVKLMKTGGIREALRTIHTAHAMGMQVMISCMVESSVSVTAAAHLAPLCEYVDLDSPLLIKNDPFEGVRYEGAILRLPEAPGLGVRRRTG